jgi:hypothetical protein
MGWQQTAKGVPQTSSDGEEAHALLDPMTRSLERLKRFQWHGNVDQDLQGMQSAEMDLEVAMADTRESTAQKPLKTVYRASETDAGPQWTAHLRIPASASHVANSARLLVPVDLVPRLQIFHFTRWVSGRRQLAIVVYPDRIPAQHPGSGLRREVS